MPGLLRAQNISRAPEFQILHGDPESRTEFSEFPDGPQALLRDLRQSFVPPVHQICVGQTAGSADPAPKLVQLGQAEPVGVQDDHGVHVGDVHAGLDDGGGHEDIERPFREIHDHVLQLLLLHPAVAYADGGLGHQPLISLATLAMDSTLL